MTARRWLTLLAALLSLGAHLAFLPRTLEDIDSINFALAVERFDVAAHQPHPPGYPVFVAAAKVSTAAVRAARPTWDRDRVATAGVAMLGIIAATAAWFVLPRWWELIGLAPWLAWLATLATLTSPLMWLTENRPLSDAPGLVVAIAVQAALLAGRRRLAERQRAHWLAAVFMAGLAVGLRSQTMWLTLPFVAWGLAGLVRQRRVNDVLLTCLAGLSGALVWFIPLVVLTGGLSPYLAALTSQGAEDFSGVAMLARSFSRRQLSVALSQTFVAPWEWRTLAHVVLGLALIGAWRLLRRHPRTLGLVCLGFAPYAVFHLAFHETATIRYALPMVVPVAGMAVAGVAGLGTIAAGVAAVSVAGVSLAFGAPLLATYAAEGAPVLRAFRDMQDRSRLEPERPVLAMHHQVWWGVRRVLDWYRPVWDPGPQPFPGDREWLKVVEHFRTGATAPVWFLGYLPRTDLAVFDPRTTAEAGRYELNRDLRALMGGARLDSVRWWTIGRPFWMLGRGWSLTPELAGMTAEDRANGLQTSARAFLARTTGVTRLVIGGRYLGPDQGSPVEVAVSIDGAPVASWTSSAASRWFVQWMEVPAAAGPGPYAVLDVRVRATGEGPAAPVGLEQFDAAGAQGFVWALTSGWYEHEEDPARGLAWRWSSAASTIEIRGAAGDRTLQVSGESPLKYFEAPPDVTIRAGSRVLKRFSPAGDFSETIGLPGDALAAAGGLVTLETNRTFRPADRGGSPDRRVLGLRLYDIRVR